MHQEEIMQRLLPLSLALADDKPDPIEDERIATYQKALGQSPSSQFRLASVLIPLVRNVTKGEWEILLTRRAKHLKHHPGEISFPGGRFEESDGNLQTTAIRETQEETGIQKKQIQIIGRLPQQNTVSQYKVTPFVGVISPDYQLRMDPGEVDEIFLIPFNYAINPDNHSKHEQNLNNMSISYYEIRYNEYNIWGATARMLINLSALLNS